MTNTQVTLVQIDNYGPWTVTPEPRREVDLQTLQSRLYADLSQLIGNRDGYVFFTRFDNMVAVTNGIALSEHERIQESIRNRYPVTISLSIATGKTPVAALTDASKGLQAAGSAQDRGRREILIGRVVEPAYGTEDDVTIAHFDVNDATDLYTDQVNAFEAFIQIEQGYAELMRYMYEENDSLSFFVGGDNIISVCPRLSPEIYQRAIEHVEEVVGVTLKVGVGSAQTAQRAGMAAKHALEDCRHRGTAVEFDRPQIDTRVDE